MIGDVHSGASSTMVFRVAIVGAGRMGQEYALAYSAFPETKIVGFVDPNEVCGKLPGSDFFAMHVPAWSATT
eukprot:COSAG02_NODE_32562_length_514_cov_1.106024_1_plen_72_part_00